VGLVAPKKKKRRKEQEKGLNNKMGLISRAVGRCTQKKGQKEKEKNSTPRWA